MRIHLRLQPGVDDDLLAFFAGLPKGKRAAAVKAALRGGMEAGERVAVEEDAGDIFAALAEAYDF